MRLTAQLVAGALVATALITVGLASPASAAAPTFAWEISQQFDDHLSTHELTGGAAEAADGVITFPGGEGSFDPETGAGTVQYDGAVAGSFVVGVPQYEITLAEPAVTIDADGHGEITAVVSASNIAGMGSGPASTDPARVVVTTFDVTGGWGDGTVTATPDWEGVLPEGPESVALGIGAGKPVDGKSFAPTFLGQITPGVRPHFYASGSSSDPKKAPSVFTATGQVAGGPVVTETTSYSGKAVVFDVSGTGFSAVTEPGDAGIYVGLAPSGGIPGDSQEDMDEFADAEWVTPAQMPDGSWSVTLDPATSDLDFGADYSIYTWQAHTHSNPSQDTETPVDIDWAQLQTATRLKLDLVRTPTTKKGGTLAVDAGKATGKVTVKLTSGGKAGPKKTAILKNGTANVALPKLAKGKWTATVSYPGGGAYKAAKKSLSFTVR